MKKQQKNRSGVKGIDLDYRIIFDAANDVIFILDEESGIILDANHKVLEVYGYTPDEVSHKKLGDMGSGIFPYSGEDMDGWIGKAKEEGPQLFEWLAEGKSKQSFWVEIELKVVQVKKKRFILASVSDITKRKTVEQEFRATKEYLNTVFNKIHDAVFVHDLNGKIIDVNDAMLKIYRCTREETVGLSIVPDFAAPDNTDVDNQPLLWQKVMAGEDQFIEWKARRPSDGSTLDVEVAITKLPLPEGDYILASVSDITQRKKFEKELRATKEYLNTVFNKIHDAVFVHDLNGKIIDVNDSMLKTYRCTREETVGLSIVPDFAAPDNTDGYYQPLLWQKVMAGEDQFIEWKARRPSDGSTLDVEVAITKLPLPEGDYILACIRDITERKNIEKLLIKEKETFFSVMEGNPHGIVLADLDGNHLYTNPEFASITGYTLEEMPNEKDWFRLLYPDRTTREKTIRIWKNGRSSQDIRGMESRIFCRDGQYKDVELRITYLGEQNLVVLTDVTARKRAEEELDKEKRKFQLLAESSPMGMIVVGGDGSFQYLNPRFTEMLGYELDDLPDMTTWISRVFDDSDRRQPAQPGNRNDLIFVNPVEGKPYTRKTNCRDGTSKYVNYIPVRLETGEILVTCEDITKQKEADDKIRERNVELEVLNDIIASVSSSLHMAEILETLKKVFIEKLNIPIGSILFFHDQTDRMSMETYWGISTVFIVDDLEAFALQIYNNRLLAHAADEVFYLKNNRQAHSLNSIPSGEFEWARHGCLYIPLVLKDEIKGIILLVSRDTDRFMVDHLPFFKTLGQQISVAIQNARLFENVRESHIQMQTLSRRLVEIQERERRDIARELHDEVGQNLTGLKLTLEMCERVAHDNLKTGLVEAQSIVSKLMALVRELSLNLKPAMLDDLGLLPTLLWHFERFTAQTNVRVVFKHTGIHKRFPRDVETAIYRIVQEALTNVARHARINEATVRIWSDSTVLGVQIADRGVGFNAGVVLNMTNSSGLKGMRERAELLGGQLTLEAFPGSGTSLSMELPLLRSANE